MNIFSFISLFGGLAMFLYGMSVMGDSLKKLSGSKLEYFLSRLTSNKFKGFLLGFVVTALIQSSSATTVMLVGFVNSGIMRLSQTLATMMGANVGTTVTAWLLSTSDINGESFFLRLLNPSSFTPLLLIAGVLMSMLAKSDKNKNIATILIGFAVLMFGMQTMSSTMSSLRDNPNFTQILVMFSNPIMGILSGLVLTAVIQSSSASVGILQALSATGVISYATAVPIILGENIGAAVPTMLSAINGNTDSKRVAAACLYIKIFGVIAVSAIFYFLNYIIGFSFMHESVNAVTIAVIHTVFNILSTLILTPFFKQIEKLCERTIKGNNSEEEFDDIDVLDDRFLSVPSFAVEKCNELTYHMAELTEKSIIISTQQLFNYDKSMNDKIVKMESKVDKYEDKLGAYLVALAGKSLNNSDSVQVTNLLHIIGDLERISDHSLNISESANEMYSKKLIFSEDARSEILTLNNAVGEILNITVKLLKNYDLELAKSVEPLEQVIDKLKLKIKDNHIQRLRDRECTVEMGFILSDILTNYERVADHCSNIAIDVLGSANHLFETHDYSTHIKVDGENDFFEKYDYYKNKYVI